MPAADATARSGAGPLSATGWGTLLAGAALLAAGYGYGYGEAAALGLTCLAAVVTAVVWTVPKPQLAAERRIAPRKVGRGDRADGIVTLTNTGTRTRRGLRATDMCGDQPLTMDVPVLRAGGSQELHYALPTARRGRITVGPLRLERTDPLGLARRIRSYGSADTLVVRPRICLLPVLPSGKAHHVEGPTSDTADDGSLTFHALREYVLGDDLRRVHWRSTARTGTLMVRQMVDVSLPHTTLVLDTRPGAYVSDDDFELAVDAAASIAYAAARSNFPVHVLSEAGPILHTDGSGNDADALLDRLALIGRSDRKSAASAFDGLEHHRGGGSLVVVTGTGDTDGLTALGRVRRRFDRVTMLRTGQDMAAPDAQGVSSATVDVPQLHIASLDALLAGWRWEAVR
ncbi:DUF58 domain-containing protein [Streptomyces sp. RKAG293]|uniref:DUF58 domain-containing protein n=1 Tax=Streptomyces sp. RKAG293 TaxID=2893403 RepID=UPI0020334513|nr:DUF58 domain-containing protein [Streptomyces sp. RKAG293]MCM2420944.1 DUF58 domain-containing protein [Streptomyces sp. RKAG293]